MDNISIPVHFYYISRKIKSEICRNFNKMKYFQDIGTQVLSIYNKARSSLKGLGARHSANTVLNITYVKENCRTSGNWVLGKIV